MTTAPSTYEAAREKYRPRHVDVLFVAEAPPADITRSFYFEDVRKHDALFWEMMKVVADAPRIERSRKAEYLRRFEAAGYFLIDTAELPLRSGIDKRKQLRESLGNLVERAHTICEPSTRIILICRTVYDVCLEPLKNAGLNVINTQFVPHPAFGHASKFRDKLKRLLQ